MKNDGRIGFGFLKGNVRGKLWDSPHVLWAVTRHASFHDIWTRSCQWVFARVPEACVGIFNPFRLSNVHFTKTPAVIPKRSWGGLESQVTFPQCKPVHLSGQLAIPGCCLPAWMERSDLRQEHISGVGAMALKACSGASHSFCPLRMWSCSHAMIFNYIAKYVVSRRPVSS